MSGSGYTIVEDVFEPDGTTQHLGWGLGHPSYNVNDKDLEKLGALAVNRLKYVRSPIKATSSK